MWNALTYPKSCSPDVILSFCAGRESTHLGLKYMLQSITKSIWLLHEVWKWFPTGNTKTWQLWRQHLEVKKTRMSHWTLYKELNISMYFRIWRKTVISSTLLHMHICIYWCCLLNKWLKCAGWFKNFFYSSITHRTWVAFQVFILNFQWAVP